MQKQLDYSILPIGGFFILLDNEDIERVMKFVWSPNGTAGYLNSSLAPKRIMHRFLIDAPKGMCVDHINGVATDNRKSNLRLATKAQNAQNSKVRKGGISKYKGVTLAVRPNKSYWHSMIRINGKNKSLGYFDIDSEIEAARAYDRAAVEYFGEFAKGNFT